MRILSFYVQLCLNKDIALYLLQCPTNNTVPLFTRFVPEV